MKKPTAGAAAAATGVTGVTEAAAANDNFTNSSHQVPVDLHQINQWWTSFSLLHIEPLLLQTRLGSWQDGGKEMVNSISTVFPAEGGAVEPMTYIHAYALCFFFYMRAG